MTTIEEMVTAHRPAPATYFQDVLLQWQDGHGNVIEEEIIRIDVRAAYCNNLAELRQEIEETVADTDLHPSSWRQMGNPFYYHPDHERRVEILVPAIEHHKQRRLFPAHCRIAGEWPGINT